MVKQKDVIVEKIDFTFPSPYGDFDVNVYRNPSNAEFQHAKNKALHNELRGLLVGNVVYIWDGDLALHADVMSLLDVYEASRFIIDNRDEFINADDNPSSFDPPEEHKMLQRMLRKT